MPIEQGCTLELLLNLSNATYKQACEFRDGELIPIDDLAPEEYFKFQLLNSDIQSSGYQIIAARGRKEAGGSLFSEYYRQEKSHLGYVVAENQSDPNSPVVIAYRGTDGGNPSDWLANLRLTFLGTSQQEYRDEAYRVYTTIRERYPNRPIVLTGHSLGGHLAQYVALKAMNKNHERNIEVRVFNSAGISNVHEKVFDRCSELKSRFISYRLNGDPVTKLGASIGLQLTIDAELALTPLSCHELYSLKRNIPDKLLKTRITGATHNKLKELLIYNLEKVIALKQAEHPDCSYTKIQVSFINWITKEIIDFIDLIESKSWVCSSNNSNIDRLIALFKLFDQGSELFEGLFIDLKIKQELVYLISDLIKKDFQAAYTKVPIRTSYSSIARDNALDGVDKNSSKEKSDSEDIFMFPSLV